MMSFTTISNTSGFRFCKRQPRGYIFTYGALMSLRMMYAMASIPNTASNNAPRLPAKGCITKTVALYAVNAIEYNRNNHQPHFFTSNKPTPTGIAPKSNAISNGLRFAKIAATSVVGVSRRIAMAM